MESEPKAPPSSKWKEAIAARDARIKGARDLPHHSLEAEDLATIPADDLIPSKHGTIGALTVTQIQSRLLTPMEPTALSKANIRSQILKGRFEDTRAELMHIFTNATGLDEDFPLSGQNR